MMNETIDQFTTRLRQSASMCDFYDESREIKSQIIIGTNSNKLRRHALQTPYISLSSLLTFGRTNELAEKHAIAIENVTDNVNVISVRRKQNDFNKSESSRYDQRMKNNHYTATKPKSQTSGYYNNNNYEKTHDKIKTCQFCTEPWHIKGLMNCKARGKLCNLCGKLNHIAKACKSRQNDIKGRRNREQINTLETVNEKFEKLTVNDKNDYILANFNQQYNNRDHERVYVMLNNTKMSFIIDTGATLNIINEHDYNTIQPKPPLLPHQTTTYAFGMKKLNILGIIKVNVLHKNNRYPITFQITKDIGPSLIGKNTALDMKLIQFTNSLSQNKQSERMEINNILRKYREVFQGIGKHNKVTVKLNIDKSIKPQTQKHRRIAFHLRDKVEKEIEELVAQDIIEKVPLNETTTWLSPIVVRPKKNNTNQIRICVDMRAANQAIKREHRVTPTIDDILYDLNGSQHFSKLDLNKGYHQFELDNDSREITTFSTHLGTYRYKRLSFGINSASEIFQHQLQLTLQGIKGAINVSDDILIYGKTILEHDQALDEVLNRLKTANLTLNQDKCLFNKTQLKFMGYVFSNHGIKPDEDKIQAIRQMTAPNNQTDIRSFLGMVNFSTKFIPHLANLSLPLRMLTKKNTTWTWGAQQAQAFENIKEQLMKATELKYFDKDKSTELWVDASPIGLGAVLTQRTSEGNANIIAYASHSLNQTEQNYSHIEKEALAITWAIKHFHLYLYGHDFQVMTDHQPLVTLFNKPNQQLSARLERWIFKLQPYQFYVQYRPGKKNPSDYMSRHPNTYNKKKSFSENLAEDYVNFTAEYSLPKTITIEEITEQTLNDKLLQQVIKNIKTGRWDHQDRQLNDQMKAFKKIKFELSTNTAGTFLLRGTRIVIPKTLRTRILLIAHSSHQGINKTKAAIRAKIWYPGINKEIEKMISTCQKCLTVTDNTHTPEMTCSETPPGPWHTINIDHKGPLPTGHYLLVAVDQYSKFPVVEIVNNVQSRTTIEQLDKIFSTFGMPKIIYTDNGAPFNSHELKQYVENMGIKHKRITPHWPRANGEVERFNRTLAKILRISYEFKTDWKREINGLLRDYRTTSHTTTGVPPADLLFNHNPNNQIPDSKHLNNPIDTDSVKQRTNKKKATMKSYHDNHHNIMETYPNIGDTVLVRNERKSKATTIFGSKPYKVTKVNGSMITATRHNHSTTRNASHFRIIPRESILNKDTESEDEAEEWNEGMEEEGDQNQVDLTNKPDKTKEKKLMDETTKEGNVKINMTNKPDKTKENKLMDETTKEDNVKVNMTNKPDKTKENKLMDEIISSKENKPNKTKENCNPPKTTKDDSLQRKQYNLRENVKKPKRLIETID